MKTNSAIVTVAALQDSAVIAVLHKSCNLPTPLLVRWLDFVFFKTPVPCKRHFLLAEMVLSGVENRLCLNLVQSSAQRRRQASRVVAADIAEDEDDVYGSRATEARSPLASGSDEDDAEGEEGLVSSEEGDLPMTGKLYCG